MDEQNAVYAVFVYRMINSLKNVCNSKQRVANTPGPSLF